ncbi:hypothetical protein JKP88DRAFT_348981 [Tribonema minus]|uniref:Uncharacterized protein n=1 Tax=Tribonema minus TaxID=303371 RepID=A0A836CFV0_9STRA|nr:hypothetical protein JKP88DRAFT_348981 [Tribonema minus]
MADNKFSIKHHQEGKRHQELVVQSERDKREGKAKTEHDEKMLKKELRAIEAAAAAAQAADMEFFGKPPGAKEGEEGPNPELADEGLYQVGGSWYFDGKRHEDKLVKHAHCQLYIEGGIPGAPRRRAVKPEAVKREAAEAEPAAAAAAAAAASAPAPAPAAAAAAAAAGASAAPAVRVKEEAREAAEHDYEGAIPPPPPPLLEATDVKPPPPPLPELEVAHGGDVPPPPPPPPLETASDEMIDVKPPPPPPLEPTPDAMVDVEPLPPPPPPLLPGMQEAVGGEDGLAPPPPPPVGDEVDVPPPPLEDGVEVPPPPPPLVDAGDAAEPEETDDGGVEEWIDALILEVALVAVPNTDIRLRRHKVAYFAPGAEHETVVEDIPSDRLRIPAGEDAEWTAPDDAQLINVIIESDELKRAEHETVVEDVPSDRLRIPAAEDAEWTAPDDAQLIDALIESGELKPPPPPPPPPDENTGIGRWQTVKVTTFSQEELDARQAKAEVAKSAKQKRRAAAAARAERDMELDLAMEADDAMGSYDPLGTGRYKGFDLERGGHDAEEVSAEQKAAIAAALEAEKGAAAPVAFKKRKAAAPAKFKRRRTDDE